MSTGQIITLVVVIIVVLAVIAVLAAVWNKRKREHNRTRAGELREQAAAQATGIQRQDAQAREVEAQAAAARAQAEQKKAEADRLEAEAADRRSTADEHLNRHRETVREANDLDPDYTEEDQADQTDRAELSDEEQPGSHRA